MEKLTIVQMTALNLIRSGKSHAEVTDAMGICVGTAKSYASVLAKKLGVETKEGLLSLGRRFDSENPLLGKLSPSELLVLEQLCKGISNNRISQNLFIAEKTVKFHLTNIFKKVNARNRYEIISMFTKSDDKNLDEALALRAANEPIRGNFKTKDPDLVPPLKAAASTGSKMTPDTKKSYPDLIDLPVGKMNQPLANMSKKAA